MPLFRKAVATRAVEVVEKRDPTAATKSLRWVTPGKAQAPDWDANTAFAAAYYANVVVYRCVELYAKTLAMLPFRVGADPDKPDDFDTKTPMARLLGPPPGGPCKHFTARQLWHWTVKQRLVTGRNGWEVEMAPGSDTPIALWPMASGPLVPIPTTGGAALFSGFVFGRVGDQRRLRPDQVVYGWEPCGDDIRQPESPLRAAYLDIAVAVMQSKYDYALLKNDGVPASIVVTEAFEDQESFEAFKRQWGSTYGGVENAGRTAFLEASGGSEKGVTGAVDVKILGVSAKDAQAAQRHTAAQERIAMALGVPWSLVDASERTFSNAGQEWRNWVTTSFLPLVADIQDMVNMQLAPRLGNGVGWFDLDKLGVREDVDPITAQVGAPAMVQAQLMTIDEARADYGLPPVPGGKGDRFMTADEIAALRGAAGPADVVRALEAIDTRMTTLEVREVPVPVPTASAPPALAPVDHEARHQERRGKILANFDAQTEGFIEDWEDAMRAMFTSQRNAVIARLEGKRGRTLVGRTDTRALGDEVFDPEHWTKRTADRVIALFKPVVRIARKDLAAELGLSFDLKAAWVNDFILAQSNRLAGEVTQTTYESIQRVLVEGVEAGESIPQLAERIRGVFDVASNSRATMIARTEVVGSYNAAQLTQSAQYGPDVVAEKEWLSAHDSRVREEHAALDGERVDVADAFSNGLAYPGEPNCRCTLVFLTPDDVARGGGRARMVEGRMALVALAAWDPASGSTDTFRAALSVAA